MLAIFTAMTYERPKDLVGAPAMAELHSWLDSGLRLKGGKDNLGFLFFYELLSQSIDFKLYPDDPTFELGAV